MCRTKCRTDVQSSAGHFNSLTGILLPENAQQPLVSLIPYWPLPDISKSSCIRPKKKYCRFQWLFGNFQGRSVGKIFFLQKNFMWLNDKPHWLSSQFSGFIIKFAHLENVTQRVSHFCINSLKKYKIVNRRILTREEKLAVNLEKLT